MSIRITESGLRIIAPTAAAWIVKGILEHQHLLPKYGIDTEKRVECFLAQCAHETQGFTRLEENLYYTTARRLMAVWPSRFKTVAYAQQFTRNPQKLANRVYGGRMGNVGPDDGWKFRGSGLKMTTGKYNFSVVEKTTGLPVVKKPEMLRRFSEALEAACIYWESNNLNRFADRGDIRNLTKAIQGAYGGLKDRRIYTERARRVNWAADASNPVASSSQREKPEIRQGSAGETVRLAQQRLLAHGYEILVDGDFGGGTDNIVREFQEDRGLMVDGVIGDDTWAALLDEPEATEVKSPEPPPPATTSGGIVGLLLQVIKAFKNA